MAGEKLPKGERERIVAFLKANPRMLTRKIARHFHRSEYLIRAIMTEEGLTRKGKSGPAPGASFEVFKPRDHGYLESDQRRQEQEARMRFEDEPGIPATDARRLAWR